MKKFLRFSKAFIAFVITIAFVQHSFCQVTLTGVVAGYPAGNSMSGVAYGNSMYIAVGYNGYIIKSTDGTSWTTVKTSTFINTTYRGVAYGNSLFVAITSDGKIVTSPDGTNWTQQTSGTSNGLNDIIYANSMFLIVGNNNTALTSTNGTTWTALNIGAASSDILMNVLYAQGKFIVGDRDAATSGCKMYYSTTGVAGTWSSSTGFGASYSLNKVVYLNNKFFAFTASTYIYTSSDAITWSSLTNSRLTTPNQVFNGFYDGTKYYLFGNSSEYGYGSAFTSTDGTTFTLQAQSTTLTGQNAAYINGRYFQMGNEGLVSSSNGNSWSFPAGSYNAVATDGTRYVAVGQNTSNEAAIFTSTDYSNWSSAISTIIKPLNGIVYANGKFVAVGNPDASNFSTYATSADGLSWATGNTGIADALRAVTYGNGKYVAVGLNGRIVYSTNGTSWTSADNGSGYHFYGVAYLNSYFIAVGGSTSVAGTAKVKYSTDGVTWTDVSPSPAVVGHFHSIAYGAGKYILVGRDNTTGSQKFFSTTTTNITSASSYTAAVTVTTPEGDVGTVGYGGVSYNNSTFVAIVNLKVAPFSAYILSSSNGASWAATPAGTTARLRGIINNGSSFNVIGTSDIHFNVSVASTLPLHLLDFSAAKDHQQVLLNWITSDEVNTDHFEIERSADGYNFNTIGQTTALNMPGNHSYKTVDANPNSGINYYRLKMVDKDAKFIYSSILKIDGTGERQMISIYPNPSTGFFTLTMPSNLPATVTMFNDKGQQVQQVMTNSSSQLVNISSLLPGTYVVQILQDRKRYTEKLIKK